MKLRISIEEQPDDSTCGPTCLHSVYNYFDYQIELEEVIQSVKRVDNGGTLAVLLAHDALKRGFQTTVYTYNLKIFDPQWANLSNEELIEKLEKQLTVKKGVRLTEASKAYIEYLKLGGELLFDNLTPRIFKRYLSQGLPVLAGLSATYLYKTTREYYTSNDKSISDDIKGEPSGHFVVLFGMNGSKIYVADPYRGNPFARNSYYKVDANRLLSAILLGIITYDANLLVIKPVK